MSNHKTELELRFFCSKLHNDCVLALGPGSCLAIVGPSGAGKTTLLNIIIGKLKLPGFRISLNGADTSSLSIAEISHCFSSMEASNTLIHDSLIANIITSASMQLDPDWLDQVVDICELGPVIAKLGKTFIVDPLCPKLSSGEIQRLKLARAVYKKTPIILLDEPTSNLDHMLEAKIFNSLLECSSGGIVVHVSHSDFPVKASTSVIMVEPESRYTLLRRG